MFFCALIFQGWPTFEVASAKALAAVFINGMVGSALCYLLWYNSSIDCRNNRFTRFSAIACSGRRVVCTDAR